MFKLSFVNSKTCTYFRIQAERKSSQLEMPVLFHEMMCNNWFRHLQDRNGSSGSVKHGVFILTVRFSCVGDDRSRVCSKDYLQTHLLIFCCLCIFIHYCSVLSLRTACWFAGPSALTHKPQGMEFFFFVCFLFWNSS